MHLIIQLTITVIDARTGFCKIWRTGIDLYEFCCRELLNQYHVMKGYRSQGFHHSIDMSSLRRKRN
jgi:hypothetical protein